MIQGHQADTCFYIISSYLSNNTSVRIIIEVINVNIIYIVILHMQDYVYIGYLHVNDYHRALFFIIH